MPVDGDLAQAVPEPVDAGEGGEGVVDGRGQDGEGGAFLGWKSCSRRTRRGPPGGRTSPPDLSTTWPSRTQTRSTAHTEPGWELAVSKSMAVKSRLTASWPVSVRRLQRPATPSAPDGPPTGQRGRNRASRLNSCWPRHAAVTALALRRGTGTGAMTLTYPRERHGRHAPRASWCLLASLANGLSWVRFHSG